MFLKYGSFTGSSGCLRSCPQRRNSHPPAIASGPVSVSRIATLTIPCSAAAAPPTADGSEASAAMSTSGATDFNQAYPEGLPAEPCGDGPADVRGVQYFSWGGTGIMTTMLDPSDYLMATTSLFCGAESDGLVSRCSTHLGDVIRDDYGQNHLDEINHLFGLVSPLTANPVTLFRVHANRLGRRGL